MIDFIKMRIELYYVIFLCLISQTQRLMERKILGYRTSGKVYLPFHHIYLLLYILVTFFVMSWMFIFYGVLFQIILDLPAWLVFLILYISLVGSSINIPVYYVSSYQPIIKARVVRVFFVPWVIPEVDWEEHKTLIAVNLGGCVIPVLLSLYIIARITISSGFLALVKIILSIAIVSILINQVAKPIPGVGIATPALVPPLFTLLVCSILQFIPPVIDFYAFLYVTGSLGALIGADLMNLKKIPYLGAPVASIGGAGTFDGVFLTGLFAVWLSLLL